MPTQSTPREQVKANGGDYYGAKEFPTLAPFGLGAEMPEGLPCRRIGWGMVADRAPLPHRRAEVAHRWIVARPGISMPVNQLPFAVLPALDLRDAQA